TDYPDFVAWYVGRCSTQRHSTKGFEDAVGWAMETDGNTLALAMLAKSAAPVTRRDQLALARRVRCPVLAVRRTEGGVTAFGDAGALARATGGRLVPIRGGDHLVAARRPVVVDLAIREFVEGL